MFENHRNLGIIYIMVSLVSLKDSNLYELDSVTFLTGDFLNMEFAFNYRMWELLRHE